jgi:hypothetical protein
VKRKKDFFPMPNLSTMASPKAKMNVLKTMIAVHKAKQLSRTSKISVPFWKVFKKTSNNSRYGELPGYMADRKYNSTNHNGSRENRLVARDKIRYLWVSYYSTISLCMGPLKYRNVSKHKFTRSNG